MSPSTTNLYLACTIQKVTYPNLNLWPQCEKLYLELLCAGGADHGGKHVRQGFSWQTVEQPPQLRYYRH